MTAFPDSSKLNSYFIFDEFSSKNGEVLFDNFVPYKYSGIYLKYFIRAVESTGNSLVESIARIESPVNPFEVSEGLVFI